MFALYYLKKLDGLTELDLDKLAATVSSCTKLGPMLATMHHELLLFDDLVSSETAQPIRSSFKQLSERAGLTQPELETFSPEVCRRRTS